MKKASVQAHRRTRIEEERIIFDELIAIRAPVPQPLLLLPILHYVHFFSFLIFGVSG